jgi:hypothetical protein
MNSEAKLKLASVTQMATDNRQRARTIVRTLDHGLEAEALLAILDVFETNADKAETFVALWSDDLRKSWIQKELKNMNFPSS